MMFEYQYVGYYAFRSDVNTLNNLCKLKMGQPPKCYESSPYQAWADYRYSNTAPPEVDVDAPYAIWIRDEQTNTMFLLAR